MRTMGWVALSALVVSACDDPAAAPPPKPPTTTAVTPKDMPPPPPPAPPPITDIPVTSSNPDAVAAYRSAVDLSENSRGEEARDQLKKAIGLDPSFASAIALLGSLTPGAEGDAMIASGIAKGTALPDAEMTYLQVVQANHLGDTMKRGDLAKKLAEMLPASARAQYMYANSLNALGNIDSSKAAYKKTLDLKPDYAAVLNELAYLEIYVGESDSAIAHLQKYVTLRPNEPNASDSLGEALLLAGKLDDAAASFKRATELNPKFTVATTGLGFVSLYRGDPKGIDALTKYRDGAALTIDEKAITYYNIAWSQAALGKTADAFKTLDAWEADAKKTNDPEAPFFAQIARIEVMADNGKADEAVKQIAPLEGRIVSSSAPGTRKARWRLFLHTDETILDGRMKKVAEADKASGLVDTLAGEVGGTEAKVSTALAHGNALLAKGDAAGAAKELAACAEGESYCLWERMKAEEKAGLKPQAAATKDTLTKARRRLGVSFFVWSKVAPAKK